MTLLFRTAPLDMGMQVAVPFGRDMGRRGDAVCDSNNSPPICVVTLRRLI